MPAPKKQWQRGVRVAYAAHRTPSSAWKNSCEQEVRDVMTVAVPGAARNQKFVHSTSVASG
ncbi:hypothetical protein [Streptomyces mexicanus]|uniref:Uncharacterized protein n=1 Tax=Streptomyces mexicanus TaxID=178566 RepID=A0A7X1I7J3_9ACTN|nr:hypothetical protein [Streptomyces mexicanus]MBC2869781.1 hypothetical protein [Streptomyces mexicanus]